METPLPLLSLCLDNILKEYQFTGFQTNFYEYNSGEEGTMYNTYDHTYLSCLSGCYELVDYELVECTLYECTDINNCWGHWVIPLNVLQQHKVFQVRVNHLEWVRVQEELDTPPGRLPSKNSSR